MVCILYKYLYTLYYTLKYEFEWYMVYFPKGILHFLGNRLILQLPLG